MIFSVDDAKEILRDFPKCKIVSASVLDAPCNIIVEVDDGSGIPNYLVGFPGPYKVRYTASIKGAKRYSTKAAAGKKGRTDRKTAVIRSGDTQPLNFLRKFENQQKSGDIQIIGGKLL